MKTTVIATYRLPGWHSWPDAPSTVSYLRRPHRHVFHFRVEVETTDPDREVEFHLLREAAHYRTIELFGDGYGDQAPWALETHTPFGLRLGSRSCEHIARELGGALRDIDKHQVTAVEVWEDGENGSRVEWPPVPSGPVTKVDA